MLFDSQNVLIAFHIVLHGLNWALKPMTTKDRVYGLFKAEYEGFLHAENAVLHFDTG